jgi:hypothetical protein
MEMVPHDHEGVQPPSESFRRLEQTSLERLGRSLPREQIPPIISPVDRVIAGPGILQPQFARHESGNISHPSIVKSQPMTP